MPKQFANWRGKPVVRHSVEALLNAGAKQVVVAIPEGADDMASAALSGLDVALATGFASASQFARAYGNAFGEPPSQTRASG